MTEPIAAALSVGAAVSTATARLEAAGVDTPRLDAELLLAEVLHTDRAELFMRAAQAVDPAAMERFESLLGRRAAREPVAYILGRRAFRHIELAVDRRVLIPRPETEMLVDVGLGLAAGAAVIDVGTGSGAVALALKQERPDLGVVGCDVDVGALAVARENAVRLGLDVRFAEADLLDGVGGRIDAVLANLPYVAEGAPLAPEITLYEPAGALYAGVDGLDVIRRLVTQLDRVSVVALEVGFDQAPEVTALLRDAGFATLESLPDLAGHERVVMGRR